MISMQDVPRSFVNVVKSALEPPILIGTGFLVRSPRYCRISRTKTLPDSLDGSSP